MKFFMQFTICIEIRVEELPNAYQSLKYIVFHQYFIFLFILYQQHF